MGEALLMMALSPDAREQLKHRLKRRLADALYDRSLKGTGRIDRELIATRLQQVLGESGEEVGGLSLSPQEQAQLVDELTSEIAGAGPLDPLLADAAVTEIMVNGPSQVYVERDGRLHRTDVTFRDAEHLLHVIERLLDSAGVSVSETEPFADAGLPNGLRLNVIVPPLALNGPTLTIRKRLRRLSMDDLIRSGTLDAKTAAFLQACVQAKVNLVVSGGTSSGKTTLVDVLVDSIPADERVITIESVAELDLANHEHWVRLVARGTNAEGRGEVSIRMLVRNALRMRPDRIILGEARGGEALDVIQAMQTGHEGVLTVVHGNSPAGALARLETLMLMSGLELPAAFCRRQVASSVELVVHLAHFPDGSRRVERIVQVAGVTDEGYALEELLVFRLRGAADRGVVQGGLEPTGMAPRFRQKFATHNVQLPEGLFTHA